MYVLVYISVGILVQVSINPILRMTKYQNVTSDKGYNAQLPKCLMVKSKRPNAEISNKIQLTRTAVC